MLWVTRKGVVDDVATRAVLQQRASRLWAALAGGSIKMPPIERLESRATRGALVLIA